MRRTPAAVSLTPLLAPLVALVLTLALTACGGGDDDAGTTPDSAASSGAVTGALPEGFPVDDVPLVEGRISQATAGEEAGEDEGFVVILQVDGTGDAVLAEAVGLLTDAGFTVTQSVGGDAGSGFAGSSLTKDSFTVTITTFPNTGDEQTTLQYLVSES
ncbi:hypothetical protein [Nocardioides sp.]|uniref:hypothetical protein n=1 Tax=Nocardioides sp. TaxID=35761 RepID=UPI00286D5BD9|nr:hypothetical protein [Nocardioides sp.]